MGDTILRVDDIQKFYGNKGNLTKAIDHLSFSVRKGEFLGIMGASGSGKTTLLNCISTIDTVTSGHIYVEEKDITALHGAQLADFRGKKLGFIFQNFNLLDTLTAYENISLALSIAGTKPSEIEQRIPQIAQALNIQDVLGKYPYQMSGGQQQRVAAARAMVTNPAIVLADEPTGALDSNSSRMLLTMLTELNERLSATILMVTHDAFSASYCNRILFIKDGQVFNELHRGTDTRKEFFTKILEVRPRRTLLHCALPADPVHAEPLRLGCLYSHLPADLLRSGCKPHRPCSAGECGFSDRLPHPDGNACRSHVHG